jgi:hypothetical protein
VNLITKGTHPAILRSVQLGWTQAKDNKAPQEEIALGFELVGDEDDDKGRFITDFNYPCASDMSLDIFVEKLRRCGWTGDELGELPALARDSKLATQVELVIDHEEYQGKWRAKVKFVNGAGGGGLLQSKNPMSEKEAASFSARMKARVRASTGVKRSAPAQQNLGHPNAPGGRRDAAPPADDNVPW